MNPTYFLLCFLFLHFLAPLSLGQHCTEGPDGVTLGGPENGDPNAFLAFADLEGRSIIPSFRLTLTDEGPSPQYYQFNFLGFRTRNASVGPPDWDILDSVDPSQLNWQVDCSVANQVTMTASLNETFVDPARRQATVDFFLEYIPTPTEYSLDFELPTPQSIPYPIGARNYKFSLTVTNWWDPSYAGDRQEEKWQAVVEFASTAQLQSEAPVNYSLFPLFQTQILTTEEDKRDVEFDIMSVASLRDEEGGNRTRDDLGLTNGDWVFDNQPHKITHWFSFESFGYSLFYDPSISVLLDQEEPSTGDGGDGDGGDLRYAHIAWAGLVVPAICLVACACGLVACVVLLVTTIPAYFAQAQFRQRHGSLVMQAESAPDF